MIPLKDDNPSRRRLIVNQLLILVNVLVFLYELSLDPAGRTYFIQHCGFIPSVLFVHHEYIDAFKRILYAMFIHGGFFHIGGNMLFLWIFGDNVEDRLGHVNYLIFYLIGGFVSFISQGLVMPTSNVPDIGASGAISAVIGAYAVFFPRARILTLIFIFIFITFIRLPAWLFIGWWFIMQYLYGMAAISSTYTSGIAWFAHIGGFIFGFVVAKIVLTREYIRRGYIA